MKTVPLLLVAAAGMSTAANAQDSTLDKAVRRARTEIIRPRPAPPRWIDFKRVQSGYAFLAGHEDFAEQVMGTSSLAATFAAQDITPVLIQTGRLPKEFQKRMRETGEWMNSIFDPPKDLADFESREYARAVDLGQLHRSVAGLVAKDLSWKRSERVPINGQAFSFVLYTFAWWPVEAMIATKQVDPVRDQRQLDDWFYLWRVLGYGMGAPEALLPRSFSEARAVVAKLRTAQYASSGAAVPDGVPVLMRGHVLLVAAQMARQSHRPVEAMVPEAAKSLAGICALSPGEVEALGLGPDPVSRLQDYAKLPQPK